MIYPLSLLDGIAPSLIAKIQDLKWSIITEKALLIKILIESLFFSKYKLVSYLYSVYFYIMFLTYTKTSVS